MEEALSCIECPEGEPRLALGAHFWPAYEAVKAYREVLRVPKSENSLEVKAQNNLQTALTSFKAELEPLLPFIRTLVTDLREFKTLPKFTLRRLAGVELKKDNAKSLNDFKSELAIVRNYLGDDYLEVIQQRLGSLKSEVIIAIENRNA